MFACQLRHISTIQTCYQMILQASNLPLDLKRIEAKLVAGGFKNAPSCRQSGIGDEELVESAKALKM